MTRASAGRTKKTTVSPAKPAIVIYSWGALVRGPSGLIIDAVQATGVPWSWDGPARAVRVGLEHVAEVEASLSVILGRPVTPVDGTVRQVKRRDVAQVV